MSTRQEIQRLINELGSKDAYVLSEMKRLGFWDTEKDQPSLPEVLIEEEARLYKEIRTLAKQQQQHGDDEALLKKIRTERMRASRAKQKENKAKRAAERLAKAEAWKERKSKELLYLGEAYSAGLTNNKSNISKLLKNNLPTIDNALDLSVVLGTTVNELRFLAYTRAVATTTHYKRYLVPKKSGGQRLISAPMDRLKKVQTAILKTILYPIPLHPAAHGFVPERSIVSNANPHTQAAVVINMDLQNFFPTFTYKRVKGLFLKLGFSEQIAIALALVCTEPQEERVEIDGQVFYVSTGERRLPQGAPSSPAISNIICKRLDYRVAGAAKKLGFKYTRYADDMTFSSLDKSNANLQKLLWQVKQIIKEEQLVLHPEKLRVMHQGKRQEVTGIIVNDKPNLDRKTVRQFRALLHQIETSGIEGKMWNGVTEKTQLLSSIQGFANYYKMVNPEKGAAYWKRTRAILKQYQPAPKPKKVTTETKKKPWWKFWG